jgi:hypothetical protein
MKATTFAVVDAALWYKDRPVLEHGIFMWFDSKVVAMPVLLFSGLVVAVIATLLFFAFKGSDWNAPH